MDYVDEDKLSRLAGVSFSNGLRLHRDSITMYNQGSYATAFHLSILAQEEIGKAFLLEEAVFRSWGKEWPPEFQRKTVADALSNHGLKQRWFDRLASDFLSRHGPLIPRFTKDIATGRLEQLKQDSTYSGLTRITGSSKVNLKGKIKDPSLTKHTEAGRQITRVNDLVVVYSEGFVRGVYGTDIYYIADQMTTDLIDELSLHWPRSSAYAKRILKALRLNKLLPDPMHEWNEDDDEASDS
jgi:AbiV family abortive infection protein